MDIRTQAAKAEQFRKLHHGPKMLLLPNAWDVASARILEEAGHPAIATTSAGIAYSLGYADGQRISREEMLSIVARIARAVRVPVTADLEAGYGDTPDAAAKSATQILKAGAIGINIEDGLSGGRRQLVGPEQHAAKIKAVRDATQKLGIRLFINARTDPFLLKFGSPDECLNEAARRAKVYADAGADGIFVPGLTDLALIEKFVQRTPLPVNIMVTQGVPEIADLARIGVRRHCVAWLQLVGMPRIFSALANASSDS